MQVSKTKATQIILFNHAVPRFPDFFFAPYNTDRIKLSIFENFYAYCIIFMQIFWSQCFRKQKFFFIKEWISSLKLIDNQVFHYKLKVPTFLLLKCTWPFLAFSCVLYTRQQGWSRVLLRRLVADGWSSERHHDRR